MAVSKRAGHLAKVMSQKAPVRGDVFAAMCPSRGVLDRVTSRWGVLVLVGLQEGTLRFSELRRRVAGVSEKMLSQTLQALEDDGFVLRKVYAVVPPRVDYTLTPMGTEVAAHIEALTDWIEENIERIAQSRRARPARATRVP